MLSASPEKKPRAGRGYAVTAYAVPRSSRKDSVTQSNGSFRNIRCFNAFTYNMSAPRIFVKGLVKKILRDRGTPAVSLTAFLRTGRAVFSSVPTKKPRLGRGCAPATAISKCRFASAATSRAHIKVSTPENTRPGACCASLLRFTGFVNARRQTRLRVAVCAALLIAAIIRTVPASARVVGTEGNVYPIHEIELTKLIAAKADAFDFEKYAESNRRQMENRVRSFRPVDAVSDLPVANISVAYKIDPTYTLPYDIRDAQGEIVYPKGYTFNPLETMSRQGLSIRTPYVIINAERPEEMRWLERKVGKSARGTFVLLITNGHAYELSERFGFPVYYLSEQVRERLAIKVTPTVIFQPQNERKYLLANTFRLDHEGRELIPKRR
jgi:conjugal transfer pilus assembly protein TraW